MVTILETWPECFVFFLNIPLVNFGLNEYTVINMDKRKEVLKISPSMTCIEISGNYFVPRALFSFA